MWIDEEGLPGRLDMCECERLLHCPNGTISAAGSENIYNCEVRQFGGGRFLKTIASAHEGKRAQRGRLTLSYSGNLLENGFS